MRCDGCKGLVRIVSLHKIGCCDKCGNKRVKALDTINSSELNKLKEWGLTVFASAFEDLETANLKDLTEAIQHKRQREYDNLVNPDIYPDDDWWGGENV